MGEGSSPEADKYKTQGRKYFFVSYLLLLLLAFTWSLGPSFVYLPFGGAAFFLFLGVRRYVEASISAQSHFRTAGDSHDGFFDQVADFFNRQRIRPNYGRPGPAPAFNQNDSLKRLLRIVGIGFGSFIGLMALIGYFTGDSEIEFTGYGDSYYANGNFDSAALYYHMALRENKESYEASVGLGKVMNAKQRYDSAVFYFDQAIMLDPDATESYSSKAGALFNMEKYSDALAVLELLFQRDESNGDAYLIAGDCYYFLKKYDEALPQYEKAYALGERSKELSYIMGYIYDVQQNYDKAIPQYQEALSYGADQDISNRLGELLK
jgi:tetratricopeptide (TPR) repeat protein